MTLRTKVTLFNAALTRMGHESLVDGQGSALWVALEANYDDIVLAALEEGDGNYPFSRSRQELTSRSSGDFGFEDVFKLPANAIHVVEAYLDKVSCERLGEPWEVDGVTQSLLINASQRKVEVEYVRSGLEHTWSAAFAQGIQRALEAVINDAEEESAEAIRKQDASEYQLLKAGVKASKNRSAKPVFRRGGGRLHRARRGEFK